MTSEPEGQRELARLVIQATSPEESINDSRLLSDIANGVAHKKAADTDAAVRALGYRLCNSDARIVLKTLNVASYLLCNVTDPRTNATNLRSVIEKDLLPKVRRLAKGLPPAPGETAPTPAAREASLRRLQEWARPSFLSGALAKHPAFADAYRDASLHTPSPPSSAAADVANSKAHISLCTMSGSIDGLKSKGSSPQPPHSHSQSPPVTRRESVASPPTDDGQFVTYFNKMVALFDKLHEVQHYPLDDEKIRSLRTTMENNLERLVRVSESVGSAQQKKAKQARQFAVARLSKFPDFKGPPCSSGSTILSSGASGDCGSGGVQLPAPPSYPPPMSKRKTGPIVRYGREASDVNSWHADEAQRATPGCGGSGGVRVPPTLPAVALQLPHAQTHAHAAQDLDSVIARVTKAQQGMLSAVVATCARVAASAGAGLPGSGGGKGKALLWFEAPAAFLPADLYPGATAQFDARAHAPPPRVHNLSHTQPAPPPLTQTQRPQTYGGRPGAAQTYPAPAPPPHAAPAYMGGRPYYVAPAQPPPPPPQYQTRPPAAAGGHNAYHQYAAYPSRAV